EQVLPRLGQLDDDALGVVWEEARRRADRWRPSLRRAVDTLQSDALPSARLLEQIGGPEDVPRLRRFARDVRAADDLGRTLARRVAPRAFVEDLGRVRIRVGDRIVEGASVRRKVVALLCLLLSRDRFSATREQVLDGIWPELDPTSALNSLN